MLVVDASVLFEVVADTADAVLLRERLRADPEHAAPDLLDAEVLAVIQSHHRRGVLDGTSAGQAADDLRTWPGQRWGLRPLIPRAWALRDNVRAYDAFYVALAEALEATLLTRDRRLADAPGPSCAIELI
jgi:predicted nucleic acid-binding protein